MEKTLLDTYSQLVASYKWSDMFVRWAFMTCVSAVLERKCWLDEEGLGYLYPNLYVVLVGPPASGKTTAAKLPIDLFIRSISDGPIICSNQLTPASLIDELKDAGQVRCQYETSPLFAFAGEFGVLIKDIGGGQIIELLLDFYDSRQPGEIWRKHTKKWGKQEMANPALTLLGCTTPKDIIESRLADTGGLGFISRVIFVCEPAFIANAEDFIRLDREIIRDIQAHFIRMGAIVGQFELTPEAREERRRIQNQNAEWFHNNVGTTILSSYMARKPPQIRKLAMLFSALRDNKKIIHREDMLRAEIMFKQTEATFMHAFGMQISYRDPGLMTKLLDKIPPRIGIPEDQLLRTFAQDGQGVPYGYEFRDAISGLVRSGHIVVVKNVKTGGLTYRKKETQ
jgi:hypothetical protein